jgi:hypothetical protein
MPRKHLFPLVVILAAAVVAGLVAFTRTAELGQPAAASTGSDAAVARRLEELGRFEQSLREQLAAAGPAAPAPRTVYRRAAAPTVQSAGEHEDDEHEEDEHEQDEHDD